MIEYLQKKFGVPYIDSIPEPGPVKIIAEHIHHAMLQSIQNRLSISIEKHKSIGISIVAHDDCAGNPVPADTQKQQLSLAVSYLRKEYPTLPVQGLWIDSNWKIQKLESINPSR